MWIRIHLGPWIRIRVPNPDQDFKRYFEINLVIDLDPDWIRIRINQILWIGIRIRSIRTHITDIICPERMFVPENPYSNELEDLFDSSQLDRLAMFDLNPGQTLQVRIIIA